MSSCPAENGKCPNSEMENGTHDMAPSTFSMYTPEEMVQQMKELITENNELKGKWNGAVWFCLAWVPCVVTCTFVKKKKKSL